MKAFSDFNPIVVFVYFLAVAGLAMFVVNPVILSFSLVGAVVFYFIQNGVSSVREIFGMLALFAFISIINPLFYHNGVTVLFVMNNNPITLEALAYGVFSAVMIISVFYWFRSFSRIMTSDRLLYLLGSASPKLALVISMTLRYIPLFSSQARKVNTAQKALGMYKDGNLIDGARGGLRVMSVMLTWALENGIITADSMTARGYGIGRRTHFSLFRFRKEDVFLLIATLLLFAVTLSGVATGAVEFVFYPALTPPNPGFLCIISYISYALLALLPTFIETEERVKWKYLTSKI